MVMWTDVSLCNALAFIYSNKGFLYPIKAPPTDIKVDIFFLELLAIVSAIHHARSLAWPPQCVLIWTDSLDSIAVLNSLHNTESWHNAPLLAIASIILHTGMDLWVWFIEGKKNVHANMLSHLLVDEYLCKFPADCIKHFSPPQELLLVQWRECCNIELSWHSTCSHHYLSVICFILFIALHYYVLSLFQLLYLWYYVNPVVLLSTSVFIHSLRCTSPLLYFIYSSTYLVVVSIILF